MGDPSGGSIDDWFPDSKSVNRMPAQGRKGSASETGQSFDTAAKKTMAEWAPLFRVSASTVVYRATQGVPAFLARLMTLRRSRGSDARDRDHAIDQIAQQPELNERGGEHEHAALRPVAPVGQRDQRAGRDGSAG